ncbi:MAG: dephospho-CoA kinase [Armatimonadota bacterium]
MASGSRRPLIVGVVGESGSGKTVVLEMLRSLGAATIEADAVARDVVAPGSDVLESIADTFGGDFIRADGSLDRKALGRLVFSDEEARRKLNALTHPAMLLRVKAQIEELADRDCPPGVVAVEAAVLREMGALELVDVVIMVKAPRALRLERIRRRDSLTADEAEARLAAQEDAGLGRLEADHVVDNGRDVACTRQQVRTVWQCIMEALPPGVQGQQ